MRNDRTTRLLLWAGVIGPLLFIAIFLIEGATRPGYSAWRNFVSQLALSNQGWQQVANFLVCGLLCLGFALGARRALAPGKGGTWGPVLLALYAFSLIIAGLFTTGPGLGYPPGVILASDAKSAHAAIHGIAGFFAFTTLAIACFILARRFAGDPAWRGWALASILIGIIVEASFFGSITTAVLDMLGTWPNAPTGLIQRIGIVVGWVWVAALAARLLRADTGNAGTKDQPLAPAARSARSGQR